MVSSGFGDSFVSPGSNSVIQLSNQDQNFESNSDIFNLATNMEMIGFSKNLTESNTEFYQHQLSNSDSSNVNFTTWQDYNSLSCVFNERPSQGLKLTLSSKNGQNQDGFLGKNSVFDDQGNFLLKNSGYLISAQELFDEFCSIGTKEIEDLSSKEKTHKLKKWDEENGSSSSSRKLQSYSLDFMELQKRKSKLISMLDEVDRRYKHYCDQMKSVVSSFEAIAGNGAAKVYSSLASKAMSRHFRCLRDGILGQIQVTMKSMGEKDHHHQGIISPGTTKGETPRLKLLDQSIRQQKALQQMNMLDSHSWRPQRGLPERSVSVLRAWLFEHFLHPYPSDIDKHILARQTGLSRSQISNWFINARVRLWKPMVEEMYLEETKEQDNLVSSDRVTTLNNNGGRQIHNLQTCTMDDKKPTPNQLIRFESECLSSIITHNPEKFDPKGQSFGSTEMDFSGYNTPTFNRGNVSLTLGLQNSFFYPRDRMEECQSVEYSLLDGEGQSRNLMGTQLLHDLA